MPEGQSAAISSRIAYRQPEQREHEMAVMNLLDDESGRQAFRLFQTFNVHKREGRMGVAVVRNDWGGQVSTLAIQRSERG